MKNLLNLNVYKILLPLTGIGTALAIVAMLTMSGFTDPDWDKGIFDHGYDPAKVDSLDQVWYAEREKHATSRDRLTDIGMGIALLCLSLATLFAVQKIKTIRQIANLKTPSSQTIFYLMAIVTWIACIPATWYWMFTIVFRKADPHLAGDLFFSSIGLFIGILLSLGVILSGVAIALRDSEASVPIFSRSIFGRPYLVHAVLTLLSGAAVLHLISCVFVMPSMVPIVVSALYLLLSGRAAANARLEVKKIQISTETSS